MRQILKRLASSCSLVLSTVLLAPPRLTHLHILHLCYHLLQEALPEPQPLGREMSSCFYVPAPLVPCKGLFLCVSRLSASRVQNEGFLCHHIPGTSAWNTVGAQ